MKPYDPTIGARIAKQLRPSLGEQIPTDPEQIAASFGRGWWKPDPQAATDLLERAGFTKRGDKWFTPDGKPFAIHIVVEGDGRPVMTRAGSMIAQEWRQFGIDASTVVAQGTMNDRRGAGDFEAMIAWSVETWGGHPDLSYFLDSWHSNFIAKPGQTQPPRNWQRWSNPDLDKIIEQIRTIGFDDPKGVALGLDYIKLVVREMPTIRLMSYNVFTVMDETYWTVADEPVSMVDASLRMSIVALFRTLRDALGVSTIYITHDLATAYTISDRIIIMRHGSVVEAGDARIVLDAPQHPYSMLLKSAILSPDAAGDPDRLRIVPLPETIANTGGRKY